ncbi:MAG TPA: hypothetical protein VF101_12880 [Gaiellaceae bacterium]
MRNLLIVLTALTTGAVCVAGSAVPADRRATDGIVYAGPKTWLPGWDGQLGFGTYYRITNAFENRSTLSWARVAYILETGSWTCSLTSYSTLTGCADSDTRRRKAYCKNNDVIAYIGQCRVHS